ncbi:hypothetical protein MMC30_002403 [Trapelia coarctata]|nr:hypothetical protein [Trapelia coarctata]
MYPTPRLLPPPDRPISYDILRLMGIIPPAAQLNALWQCLQERRNTPDSAEYSSPLGLLYTKVLVFFSDGPDQASASFLALQQFVESGSLVISPAAHLLGLGFAHLLPWNLCKLATALVLMHAAPANAEATLEILGFNSRRLGGLPDLPTIHGTPSADLSVRFAVAKKAAVDGNVGDVTVLGVNLVDVEMIERGEKGGKSIAKRGFPGFQSWGEHGYRLDEYLERDGARLRSWDEAKDFLKAFGVLVGGKGLWTKEINDAYEKYFEVDIFKICGGKGPQRPIVPKYRPWVNIYEINDVKSKDIEKFTWS